MSATEVVASVRRRHGAWLVQLLGSGTDDLTPLELFDAASTFVEAQLIAEEGAAGIGFVPGRWTVENGTHYLEGRPE